MFIFREKCTFQKIIIESSLEETPNLQDLEQLEAKLVVVAVVVVLVVAGVVVVLMLPLLLVQLLMLLSDVAHPQGGQVGPQ